MRTLDEVGAIIERQLDSIELRFGSSLPGSTVLGTVLALGVIGGGLAAFIAVFAVLVGFFS